MPTKAVQTYLRLKEQSKDSFEKQVIPGEREDLHVQP